MEISTVKIFIFGVNISFEIKNVLHEILKAVNIIHIRRDNKFGAWICIRYRLEGYKFVSGYDFVTDYDFIIQ